MHRLTQAVAASELIVRVGRLSAVRGTTLESAGPAAQIGEVCMLESPDGASIAEAEVLGFDRGATVLMACGTLDGLAMGARVTATGRLPDVPVGPELLGRVVDAFGRPIDGSGMPPTRQRRSLRAVRAAPMQRRRIETPLETGIKVIDTMLTLAKGQRIGLFAGSGVGKSTLMGSIAQGTQADVIVIALIGERSREVREFVEDRLGADALARSVVVAATSSEPAVVRLKAAYAATAIAEHFRDEGRHVLLLMDSLTRFAMARREVGLALGEPPTSRGYTPSVFAELPQLCERSGTGAGGGSITGVYTVLVEGDDLNEPLSDAIRGILDGHIVLSRELAQSGHYPAIDVLRSVSRLHAKVAAPEDVAAARKVVASCALYERNRSLIEIGAYKAGVNAALDGAVHAAARIAAFLAQADASRVSRSDALQQLRRLAAMIEVPYEPA